MDEQQLTMGKQGCKTEIAINPIFIHRALSRNTISNICAMVMSVDQLEG